MICCEKEEEEEEVWNLQTTGHEDLLKLSCAAVQFVMLGMQHWAKQ